MKLNKILFAVCLVLLSIFFVSNNVFSDTHIPSGEVSGTWTIDGSPYIIDGHVVVPVDSLLSIEPGVDVIFSDWYIFRVHGRLLSLGTANDSINFTSQDTTIGWKGLKFYDLNVNQQDSSKILYTILEEGKDGSMIYLNNSSCVLIDNCNVLNNQNGSGICCSESNPKITNTRIINNTKIQNYGGGLYITENSSPYLYNVVVKNNEAAYGGGIACSHASHPTMEDVSIFKNSSEIIGAGLYCAYSSNPILNNVVIEENEGIGMYCNSSSPILDNVIIRNNEIGMDAQMCNSVITNTIISGNGPIGGFRSIGGDIVLRNVIISDNENTGPSGICFGGGMHINGKVSIVNALIINNYIYTLNVGGGGIFNVGGDLNLTNVAITGNYAEPGCGGIWGQYSSNTKITNSIIWDNNDSSGSGLEIFVFSGWDDELTISYTDIEGGEDGVSCGGMLNWGEGNIDLDPLFADTLYHLSGDSPCIDAGNPDTMYYDPEDPNNPGYALYPAMGTVINDMGFYGGHGNYEPINAVGDEPSIPGSKIVISNSPNPFIKSTIISFSIKSNREQVSMDVYNIKGQRVKTLLSNELVEGGSYDITWNGKNRWNKVVGSGIYFIKLRTEKEVNVKKVVKLHR